VDEALADRPALAAAAVGAQEEEPGAGRANSEANVCAAKAVFAWRIIDQTQATKYDSYMKRIS
jgi:hypothetical protein